MAEQWHAAPVEVGEEPRVPDQMQDDISLAAKVSFWDRVVLCTEKRPVDMLITAEQDEDARCKVTDKDAPPKLKGQLVWCYMQQWTVVVPDLLFMSPSLHYYYRL